MGGPARKDNWQQTNSQAQAGAASQVVVNLFLLSTDGLHWTVKPVVYVREPAQYAVGRGLDGEAAAAPSGEREVGVDVASASNSNAQGQGLTVQNTLPLWELIQGALELAGEDREGEPPRA